MRKSLIVLFIMLLSPLVLGSCSKENWEGYVYPDKSNLLIHHQSGSFNSLEECKDASMAMLKANGGLQNGYYECGKNCKADRDYYDRECEETVRGNLYK